jgi:hypothetical protein
MSWGLAGKTWGKGAVAGVILKRRIIMFEYTFHLSERVLSYFENYGTQFVWLASYRRMKFTF